MAATLTTAFLGVAHIHTPNFVGRLNARAEEVRVAAVYDHDSERGTRRAAELGGAVFVDNPRDALAMPDVGSVVICAETNRHRELVIAAAEAGKHIFCEKPLGLGREDSAAMAAAIKSAGVTFQTGFFLRGLPEHQFIKREVHAGHLGKLTRMRYTNCHQAALDGWFDTEWRWITDPKLSGGGALLDLGAHPLDLIVSTFPETEGEIVDVRAFVGNRGGRYGQDIDEYGSGLLAFASGAIAELEASWVDPQLRSPIEIQGTDGQIRVEEGKVTYFSKHVEGYESPSIVSDLPAVAPHAFELFWDALLGRPLPVPLVTVDEAARGSALMEELYRSAGRETAL